MSDGKRILEKGIVGRGIDDSHVVVDAAVVVGDSCNGRDATVTRGAQSNLRKRLWNRVCTPTWLLEFKRAMSALNGLWRSP